MKRLIQWIAPLFALLLLGVAVLYVRADMGENKTEGAKKQAENIVLPDVSVVTSSPGSYMATISGYGESVPHYSLSLVAEVSGRVKKVGVSFESGNISRKGELLVQLDNKKYLADVATAKSDLEQNKLNLLEEERQMAQAKAEWESSGLEGEPDSELVLRRPQLAAAKAMVASSKAALELAEDKLAQTEVYAPYDCLVVARNVSPSSYLQEGSTIGSFYSVDKVEISVPLSTRNWDNLPKPPELSGYAVKISAVDSDYSWEGSVNRVERSVDTATRQRDVVVEVLDPFSRSTPLLPGIFVQIEIHGKEVDNLWRLPMSALSQRGEIWYVVDGTLDKFSANLVFSNLDKIYIEVPESLGDSPQQVLVHPLSNYVSGMNVHPVEVKL
ncbi:efflux RND transporter periplasmic adaptor subunit [Desulfogranum japonicum]|uniref:efflux RND transporter periplasmic adaptor subunit n=1 Tax=Desulfogranum japonicum TaxID=231447 RepID=UPI000419C54B|nr:efflux RND transporter periplasmic adaptor subunit [Desulfogranum japonicum]